MSSTLDRERVATSDIDPFAGAFLADPYPFHEQLREADPVVRLAKYDVYAVARYAEAHAILNDWQTFGSRGGVRIPHFQKEANLPAPSLLFVTDPPKHHPARAVTHPELALP